MPRGQGTTSMKSPARQEMEDVQEGALASVADALEASNKWANTKEDSAGPTLLDGECYQEKKFAIHVEVEKTRDMDWCYRIEQSQHTHRQKK